MVKIYDSANRVKEVKITGILKPRKTVVAREVIACPPEFGGYRILGPGVLQHDWSLRCSKGPYHDYSKKWPEIQTKVGHQCGPCTWLEKFACCRRIRVTRVGDNGAD